MNFPSLGGSQSCTAWYTVPENCCLVYFSGFIGSYVCRASPTNIYIMARGRSSTYFLKPIPDQISSPPFHWKLHLSRASSTSKVPNAIVNPQFSSFLAYQLHQTQLMTPSLWIYFLYLALRTPHSLSFLPSFTGLSFSVSSAGSFSSEFLMECQRARSFSLDLSIFTYVLGSFISSHGFKNHLNVHDFQIDISIPDLSTKQQIQIK